jgi:hypothetical protein
LGPEDNEWVADHLQDNLVFYQAYPITHLGFVIGRDMSYLEDVSDVLAEIYNPIQ